MTEYIIRVENLSKKFGAFQAVKDISINVKKGITFGFLGPNGAGKSTTIKILCTLLKPSDGKVSINDFDVVKDSNLVRKSIGIVFQDPSLDENLTAYENLLFHAMLYGLPKKIRDERINQVLKLVELNNRNNSVVKTFSGGMKRRLEIARGLLHYPKVLFLDEPTIGLDPQTRAHIWDYIKALQERENITIFLTTHYMEEAENCHQIAVIDHGEIAALGSPGELKSKLGKYFIELKTHNNENAINVLKDNFSGSVYLSEDKIILETASEEEILPEIINLLQDQINYVNLREPTLNDVFLALTGRSIRDEGPRSNKEIMVQRKRSRR